MNPDWLYALGGGLLIGTAASLMLLWNGRVVGISGIIYGLFTPKPGSLGWRWSFLGGLGAGGLVVNFIRPEAFGGHLAVNGELVLLAGVIVGFGTSLGSGCTSGHGVCGISRFSPRSILATFLFISAGVMMVAMLKRLEILP